MPFDKSSPITLGLVYADWCGHCEAFKPEWTKIEDVFRNDPSINVVKINDADTEKAAKLAEIDPELKADAYPTIFKKKEGEPVEYYKGDGERTSEAVIAWALLKKGGCGCGIKLWRQKKSSKKRKSLRKQRRRKTYRKARKN